MPVPLILLWRKTVERLLAALTGCFFFFLQKIPNCVSTGIPKPVSNQFRLISALNNRIEIIQPRTPPVRADTARKTAAPIMRL